MSPNVIKAQKIPSRSSKISADDQLARFCFYFPRYSFFEASKMPAIRIAQMIRIAEKEYARHMYDLTVAVSAPHGKKGSVEKVLEYFKRMME